MALSRSSDTVHRTLGDRVSQGSLLTQRYLNITDEELRKAMTGVWERRRQLRAVSQ